MKPDDAMPFFGTAFFEATEGYTDAVITGYLRALWHYWNHTHCQGLPDDDDYLRRICHCDSSNWARTKAVIFDNQFFFCKNGTHWHQKKARELHSKEVDLYQRRVTWAENARQQKAQANISDGVKADISPSVLRISQEKELERVSQRIKDLLAAGTQVAGAQMTYTTPQKAELKALKDRREQLKKGLGFIACLILLLAVTLRADPITNPPTRIAFAWDASLSTNAITNYAIYWGPASAFYTNWVNLGTNLTGVVSNLDRGQTYYFAATCKDTNGLESLFSNEVSTNLPAPPPAPANLRFQ